LADSDRDRLSRWRIPELLAKYSGLRLLPSVDGLTRIAGRLDFAAQAPGLELIEESYDVEITVPHDFPTSIASVRETAGRIPATYHTLTDGSLCLGSRIRVRLIASASPSVLRFVERCVVPYLYGHSYFGKHGAMPFGELEHGEYGTLQDLASLFGTTDLIKGAAFARLVTMKKRRANKRPCPCGSQLRLGRCHNKNVNRLRDRLGRAAFQRELQKILAEMKRASSKPAQTTPLPATRTVIVTADRPGDEFPERPVGESITSPLSISSTHQAEASPGSSDEPRGFAPAPTSA
jgi:hypothetical protein